MTIFKRNLLLFTVILFLSVNATSQNMSSSITDLNVKVENKEKKVYEDILMQNWNIFENYFIAGNYLLARDN